MTMSEIKKGDWVYVEEDEEHIFQCSGTGDGILIGGDDWWFKDCCRRLEPLKPGDKLEVGDRVVVIGRVIDNDPGLGTIHRVIEFTPEARRLPIIDAAPFGWIMEFKHLARLPDYAQDERCETSDEKETHCVDDVKDDQPIPYVLTSEFVDNRPCPDLTIPCPHPEWEGIWLAKKEVRRVKWCPGNGEFLWGIETVKAGRFATYSCGWVGPQSEGWTMLEPAPCESISGPKLERPRKHGEIKTPWDPWDI
jgi:hypothetical protein